MNIFIKNVQNKLDEMEDYNINKDVLRKIDRVLEEKKKKMHVYLMRYYEQVEDIKIDSGLGLRTREDIEMAVERLKRMIEIELNVKVVSMETKYKGGRLISVETPLVSDGERCVTLFEYCKEYSLVGR